MRHLSCPPIILRNRIRRLKKNKTKHETNKMKERKDERPASQRIRWPGTRGLGCHVRPTPDLLHRRHPATATGARGEARPSSTFSLLCFFPRILLQRCLQNPNCTLSASLNLPWVFHLERTLLYMYNFCFKVFFLNKTYICCLFTYLRDCVVGFSPWREFTVSKGAGWSQSAV